MENDKFQELVLSHLSRLSDELSALKEEIIHDMSGLEGKLDLVYNYVIKLTETQTTNQVQNSNRLTKVEKSIASLAELYGRHEVEIRNIKSALL